MKRSNIEITRDNDDWVMFKTTCECGLPDHSLSVIVQRPCGNEPLASLFFECIRTDSEEGFFKKIRARIADACHILFTGFLKVDEEFLFRDRAHLEDLLAALRDAADQVIESAEAPKPEEPAKAGEKSSQ